MNRIFAHIENEIVNFRLSKKQLDFGDTEYRDLAIGENLNLFLTDEQAEKLFDVLDNKLHPGKTYSDLQDLNISTEIDLDNANDLIGMYQDNK